MKTIGRILIIFAAAALIGAAIFAAVNAGGSAAAAGIRPPEGAGFALGGARAGGFREGGRPGRGGEGGGWLFDTIKNLAIVAIIVTAIVLHRKFFNRRAAPAAVKIE